MGHGCGVSTGGRPDTTLNWEGGIPFAIRRPGPGLAEKRNIKMQIRYIPGNTGRMVALLLLNHGINDSHNRKQLHHRNVRDINGTRDEKGNDLLVVSL